MSNKNSIKQNWVSCSNIYLPKHPQGILTTKKKYLNNNYKGRGRPKKTDYCYKSAIDLMFDMNTIYNEYHFQNK